MQRVPAFACLLLTTMTTTSSPSAVSGHAEPEAEPRAFKPESMLMGIAKSLIARKKGSTTGDQCIDRDVYQRSHEARAGFCTISSFTVLSSPCKFFKMANGFCDLPDILSLSLNMSNIVLMLVLRGLMWGVSHVQSGGKESRNQDATSVAGLKLGDVFTETDAMLFLGYVVADQSGHYDCLSRVACERPRRAESYHKSAAMVWKTLTSVLPSLDAKYDKILIGLQEAIDYGRADGDCQSKYKCFDQKWP